VAEFQLSTRRDDDRTVVALAGELDLASSSRVTAEVDRVLGDPAGGTLVLDLSGLQFMDSSGLRCILRADAVAGAAGRPLALVPGPPAVHRVFEMTGMHTRLPFEARP
jgi:anti-anti-sigma factor